MKNEKISYNIKCIAQGNAFQPNILNADMFIETDIVKDSDGIQVSHPGELVAYFKLKDDSTIKTTRNEISITSKSYNTSFKLFNVFKSIYSKARLKNIEFEIDEHFIDSAYPELVFDKFVSVKGMELDVFRYKKDDIMFLLYNCHPHRMHLKMQLFVKFEKPIMCKELDFKSNLIVDTIMKKRESFVKAFLK